MKHVLNIKCLGILKYRIIVLFFLATQINFAQSTITTTAPQLTLPSPTAFSMIKYTDAPINISGGRPDVSVPIYTISVPGITVPVSYNYGAGGIKVDEVASSYGLGWNLIAGGSITRVVRGVMDESGIRKTKGEFDDMTLLLNVPNSIDIGTLRTGAGITDVNFGCEYFDIKKYNNYNLGIRPFIVDLEPDVFYFNFGGYSGKFMFENSITPGDESVMPVFFPKRDDIKIRRVMGTEKLYPLTMVDRTIIKEWVVTTPDGIEYYFGQNDTREYNYNYVYTSVVPDDRKEEVTGWFLTRIYNPLTKEEVTFNYNKHNYSYTSALDEVYTRAENVYDFCGKEGNIRGYLGEPILKVNQAAVRTYVLSDIISSKIKVSFKGTTNRLDVEKNSFNTSSGEPDVRAVIDKIEIFDRWHNKILKKYNLNYSYFISNSMQSSYLPNYVVSSDDKRLRLNSVTELNANDEVLPSYIFSYNDEAVFALPRRRSFARDKWGYYNGQLTNSRLLPFCEYAAIRDSDPVKAKAFMLKKVTYPSGGTHSFEYGYNAGVRLDKITIQDVNTNAFIENKYDYDQGTLLNVTNQYDFADPAGIADVTVVSGHSRSECGSNQLFDNVRQVYYNNTFYLQANPYYISPGMGSFKPLKILSSSPILSSQIPNFSSPIYGTVTVTNMENNISKGKHVYGYHRPSYLSWLDKYPSIPEENSLYGKPEYEEYWDAAGTRLRRDDFNYTETADTRKINGIAMSSSRCYLNVPEENFTSNMLFYRFYTVTSKSHLLKKKTITEYFGGQQSISTEEYSYNSNNKNDLPNRITKSSSDGGITVEEKLYSSELYGVNTALTNLYAANRWQELIQSNTSRNAKTISKSKKDFTVQSSGVAMPSEIFTAKGTNPLESKLRFSYYDDKGNPLEFLSSDGARTVIVWGYNKQYPIAEIKAKVITYAFFDSYATNLQNLSNLDIDAASEENLRTELNKLRVTFPDDMITTYTYDPNIGITSVTDPKGDKTTYTYDSFGRLESVKDVDGNLLSKNEYHYKN